MSELADWAHAYARQADVDLKAWELHEIHPAAVAANCHRLLFLQMACEKICKAYLIQAGAAPKSLQSSHGHIAGPLLIAIRQQIVRKRRSLDGMRGLLNLVRHLAEEVEVLNPSVRRDGRRPDNCEYPWETEGRIYSPLDWTFSPLRMMTGPSGRTFLKLLRGVIDRILDETENDP